MTEERNLNAYQHKGNDNQGQPSRGRRRQSNSNTHKKSDHRKDNRQLLSMKKTTKKAPSMMTVDGRGRRSKHRRRSSEPHDRRDEERQRQGLDSQRQRKTLDDRAKTMPTNHGNTLHNDPTIKSSKYNHSPPQQEPGIAMDTTWFLYGLGILVVGNLLVVQLCTYVAGGRGGDAKGRRSL